MYLDIINSIKSFFENHNQVYQYKFGNIDNLSTINMLYPLVWCQPEESTLEDFNNVYSFTLYCLTLLELDNENLKDSLEDTFNILKDFISTFRQETNDNYWLNDEDLNINVISGEFDDHLIGWELNISFNSINDYQTCYIPKQ